MHIQFIVISIRFLPSQSPKKRLTLDDRPGSPGKQIPSPSQGIKATYLGCRNAGRLRRGSSRNPKKTYGESITTCGHPSDSMNCWMFTAGCSPKIKWHLPSHSMPFNWCGAFVSSDAESKSSLTERCSRWWGTVMRPETGCKVCSFFKIYNF